MNEWRPLVRGEQWQVIATFVECFADSEDITLSQDHDHFLWIKPEEYKNYKIIETNIPAFEAYLEKD